MLGLETDFLFIQCGTLQNKWYLSCWIQNTKLIYSKLILIYMQAMYCTGLITIKYSYLSIYLFKC